MNCTLLLIIFISLVCTASAKIKYRLSTNVRPSFYSIKIHPDLDHEVFNGEVTIHVRVDNLVETIALHSSQLNITTFYLNADELNFENGTSFGYKFSEHQLVEIYRINGDLITPGDYNIYIRYNGTFSKTEFGFFKAKIPFKLRKYSYLAVTNLEPTNARQVFPCFDEPFFKAKFQLNLVVPNNSYRAISNVGPTEIFETSYGIVYKFKTTKPMSSYLLAFAVTNFSYEELIYDNVAIRAYSYLPIDKKVLEYVAQSLNFFANFTNYSNPLAKIDVIEYDRGGYGATENWGLITVSSGILSFSYFFPQSAKIKLLTHEIAHFWFGNLVTNTWWDDIWLQEGFAVYMGLKPEEYILKNNATKRFSKNNFENDIYWLEQKRALQPVVNFVETPSTILANFNKMPYSKGAAVLQMIETVLGEENFRNALRIYISKYAFKTATTEDLLNILENFAPSGVDLRGFIYSYLYQTKFPLIQVVEDEEDYILTQLTYLGQRTNDTRSKWTIPISYVTSLTKDQERQPIVWYDKNMEYLKIPKGNETWIKFNPQQKFLYRTNYSEEFWSKFVEYAEEMEIDDRDHLFVEAIQLYGSGLISCDIALNYLEQASDVVNNSFNLKCISYAHDRQLSFLAKYDKEAHTLVKNFMISKGEQLYEGLSCGVHRFGKNNEEPSTENITSCIRWIKENLQKYSTTDIVSGD